MLKKIAIGVGVFLLLVAGAGVVLPKQAHAEKSLVINAPADAIYPQIASLKAWNDWSEWNTRADPKWKPVYSGPDLGAGAGSSWTESESGAGTQTITAAEPGKSVDYRIDVADVGLAINGKLALTPEGAGTRVTWTDEFDLSKSYMMRYFGPLMGGATEEKMEASLKALKAKVEQPQKPQP